MEDNFEIAKPQLRFLSFVIDRGISTFVFLLLISPVFMSNSLPYALNSLLSYIGYSILIFAFILPLINCYLISRLGGTVGKLAAGTAIVNTKGEKISFWRAYFRNFLGYSISSAILGLGFLWILNDPKRRGWHDMIAGTYVAVKNKSAYALGVVLSVILVFLNLIFVLNIYSGFIKNKDFYIETFEAAKTGALEKPSPTPPIPYTDVRT